VHVIGVAIVLQYLYPLRRVKSTWSENPGCPRNSLFQTGENSINRIFDKGAVKNQLVPRQGGKEHGNVSSQCLKMREGEEGKETFGSSCYFIKSGREKVLLTRTGGMPRVARKGI